jgi:hypothetical protein
MSLDAQQQHDRLMTTNPKQQPDPDRDRRLTRPNLTPEQQAEWRKTADPEMERAFGFA